MARQDTSNYCSFIYHLLQVSGLLQVLQFPPPIKLNYCWVVFWKSTNLFFLNFGAFVKSLESLMWVWLTGRCMEVLCGKYTQHNRHSLLQTVVSLSLSHHVTLPVTSLIQTAVSLSWSHRVSLRVTSLMQTTVSLSLSHRVTLPVTSLMQTAVSLSLSHHVTFPVTSLMQTAVNLSLSHCVTLPVFNCQFSLKTLENHW